MKLLIKPVAIVCLALSISSCGGWTERDQEQFHEACDKMTIGRVQCDCMMDKAKVKFDNFDAIKEDQAAFAEIIMDAECLEKGRETAE